MHMSVRMYNRLTEMYFECQNSQKQAWFISVIKQTAIDMRDTCGISFQGKKIRDIIAPNFLSRPR